MNKLVIKTDASIPEIFVSRTISAIVTQAESRGFFVRQHDFDGDHILEISAFDWRSASEIASLVGKMENRDPEYMRKLEHALEVNESFTIGE